MFIYINKFSCKFMKFINKDKKTVCKYLNWLEFQIPAFRTFCKTAVWVSYLLVYLRVNPQRSPCQYDDDLLVTEHIIHYC